MVQGAPPPPGHFLEKAEAWKGFGTFGKVLREAGIAEDNCKQKMVMDPELGQHIEWEIRAKGPHFNIEVEKKKRAITVVSFTEGHVHFKTSGQEIDIETEQKGTSDIFWNGTVSRYDPFEG